jgi:glycerol-3-phosphate dehydrogenase
MAQQDNTVLVIGAGINGVAITRELLLNRVPVCLVDRWDIAYGTTAYSSRLIHGGLRYLEFGDVKLVRESLEERERLLQLSPQFVRPIHLFIPIERRVSGFFAAAKKFFGWESSKAAPPVPRGLWLVNMGLWMYDALARRSRMPRHQVFRVNDPSAPPVNAQQYRWLCSYYDAQIEFPERFVLALLEDARGLAQEHDVALEVLTYHEATKDGSLVTIRPCRGSVSAARTLMPIAIINSTGAWVDQALAQLGIDSPELMGGTKGSHLLIGGYHGSEVRVQPRNSDCQRGRTGVPAPSSIGGVPASRVDTRRYRDALLWRATASQQFVVDNRGHNPPSHLPRKR